MTVDVSFFHQFKPRLVVIALIAVVGANTEVRSQNLVASNATEDLSLSEIRDAARAKSRFLQEIDSEQKFNLEQQVPLPDVAAYERNIRGLLFASCLDCHGPDESQGRIRMDLIDPDLLAGKDVAQWREIYSVISNHEMPPEDDDHHLLTEENRSSIIEWLSGELAKASIVQRKQNKSSSFRRLTKYEYDYALQDLLGVRHTLARELPPETSTEDGFQNASSLLQMSMMQFESYRKIGLDALKRATVGETPPSPVRYVVEMRNEWEREAAKGPDKVFTSMDEGFDGQRRRTHLWNVETQSGIHFSTGSWKPVKEAFQPVSASPSGVVLAIPRSGELKMNLDRFLPDDGIMQVRLLVSRSTQNSNEHAGLRLSFSAHTSNNANFMNVISKEDKPVTASGEDPQWITFDIQLQDIQRNPFRKLETTFPRRDEFLHIKNIANSNGEKNSFQVFLHRIEISAPHFQEWPPESHTRIFFDSPNRNDEQVYGREVLGRFLRKIWARVPEPAEVDRFLTLFGEYRKDFPTFESAMLEVLATALATPEFLYLTQRERTETGFQANVVDQYALARRLAAFLWSSLPDDTLVTLAEKGELAEPEILDAQIDRMLDDERANRFSEHFVDQWLGLDGLNGTDHIKDQELLVAMRREPVEMFKQVLATNRSILDFLHADYVMVNERLARHYQIRDVYGPDFQRIDVKPEQHRGGFLTCAAILAMNSDGKDSHPLKRGVWMLERILNDPPPPPPPNVPEVDLTDPRILEMTLKERLADHRDQAACRSCHSRIDPWGISLEQYDALGAYRTRAGSQAVDASSTLFNGHQLDGIDGLKRFLLLERQDQFSEATVHKLVSYALGRRIGFADHAEVEDITRAFRKEADGLRDLIRLVVHSDLFLQMSQTPPVSVEYNQ